MKSATSEPLRVALLSTTGLSSKGSMRAYAETLIHALERFSPQVRAELVELDPEQASGAFRQRARALALPWLAWRQRRRAPQVWHVLDGSRAYCATWLPAASLVVTVHDIIPWLQDRGRFAGVPPLGGAARTLWRANARVLRSAAALACASANSARDAKDFFDIAEDRCRVITLPLRPAIQAETERVGGAREPGCVLHVGNGAYYKNREGALRVFAACRPEMAKRLFMAGPPPSASLLALMGELGIGDRVQWLVDPDDARLVQAYRSASVLLFPSRYEGFGWPVLEAMALGLPVVASRAGSLPEVAGDAAAFEPDDIAGMAAALDRLLGSPELAAAAAARGQKRAADFGAQKFAARMQATYHAVATANRAADK